MAALLLDLLYGTLPAPFFVVDGKLAPDLMMTKTPPFVLVILSVALAAGSVAGGSLYLGLHPITLAVPIAVHWLLFFFHALPNSTEKLFDLAGQLAFSGMITVSWTLGRNENIGQVLLPQCLIYVWSVRLGAFLFRRFLERKGDFRFVKARKRLGYFFFSWTAQGFWCLPVAAPLLLLHAEDRPVTGSAVLAMPFGVAGVAIFLAGLAIEAIADVQKLAFVRRQEVAKLPRTWIAEGVWRYSRHPNYCGECMVWLGAFLICAPHLAGSGWPRVALAAASPVFSTVFLMQTSLPWLEAVADERFGGDKAYRRYKRETSAFLLLPRRRRNTVE